MTWFRTPLDITKGVMFTVTMTFVIVQAIIIAAVVVLIIGVSDQQRRVQENARNNALAIRELQNTDRRLRRIEQPTQQQLTQAALDALRAIRSCARSATCRRQNPGVTSVARSIPRGEIPRRAPRQRSSNSGGGTSPNTGATTGGSVQRPAVPSPPSRTPQPTVRPPTTQPTRSTPANPPASTPVRPPAATQPSVPTPKPPVQVPTITTPPVTVPPVTVPPITVPPVTAPVPVRICTPVITVNCREPGGRIVTAQATADPESNSGRGSLDDELCDRLKVPCDDAGDPVFPPGLIRFA